MPHKQTEETRKQHARDLLQQIPCATVLLHLLELSPEHFAALMVIARSILEDLSRAT